MKIFYPVQIFSNWLTFEILDIKKNTLAGGAVNFFIFDTLKILILLAVIIFFVSLLRSFLPLEKIRKIISARSKITSHILASLLGIVTPFCSCSAVTLFLGFVEAGVPLGATFSFLVASPMINEVALVMLFGLFGWKVAIIYVLSGLTISIVSGLIIDKLSVENLLLEFTGKKNERKNNITSELNWKQRMKYAYNYTAQIICKIWPYIIVGIGIGAWIHGFIPADFLVKYAGADKWYAVPLAAIIGIPLYSNAAGVIPLVYALTEKGVALGTTLAFMMAVTGLSLPEFMILKRVMKTKLIVIFASVVGLGIIFTGYLFNAILK